MDQDYLQNNCKAVDVDVDDVAVAVAVGCDSNSNSGSSLCIESLNEYVGKVFK